MTKISDIAAKASVSITAVSLALNNKPGVSEETKNRILQIAKEMNYTKTVKQNKVGSLRLMRIVKHGHTINTDHDNFLSHYIDNITRESRNNSCELQTVSCSINETNHILKGFIQDGIMGVIVIGTELTKEDVREFECYDIPIVFIDTYHPSIHFDFVNMDNYSAVNDIVTLLVKNGHKEIGLVSSPVDVENFRRRERAFKTLITEYEQVNLTEYNVHSTFEGAQKDFEKLIEGKANLPTALFCVNDIIALGCMKTLKKNGIQIPEDISVVGFDNLPQSRMSTPALTTVQVNHAKISEFALRLLFDRIESDSPELRLKVSVGTSLIIRESVRVLN
ncbi:MULTISPECIES: LacI family DNA-binding transcriptional regulator [unclassified Oceanispirochaeta]|uniref:LacI family DNA-binding transcriptional regulator n=1 Tax=unclassified Oceanispirochaeta TaxID=2635722 RepID=UPI000E09CEB6|nr:MULTISPECIES: LacI family DNA-binding transcriptional regulator [unclassified Oceanispirochaeta]MBF9015823.1 LacI family DNA-binding transcriptional regulator [Oceanispirochaeta sp. M2]NPD72286.1 LacI family transcriptional regulator [Oceanispirochaeta sp. M1]RDG32379.1 LacI family transcriptional regulator [Oceanispirochaeta sp. M1]